MLSLYNAMNKTDYAKYVDRIRKHAILLPIEEAVEQATQDELYRQKLYAELKL